MPGPLDGIRILDFTWALAGPFGTMILCDLGAEVWKIEPAGIDERRRGPGPYVDGISTYFFSVNRGKKSITLDLKTEEAREIVYKLVKHVDVVTENFSPGTMAKLGLGYNDLKQHNPRIVYASTSGFGQTGPYREKGAVDVIVQAYSGIMSITGYPDGPPTRPGYSIGDMAGGMFTAIGVLAALRERDATGRGQHVDVSMLDSQVTLLENAVIRYTATGEVPGRIGTRHPLVTPFQVFPTRDGYIAIAGTRDWELFCARIGRDDLMMDERFKTNELRTQHHGELEPELSSVFQTRTTQEWLEELDGVCLVAPVNTIDQMVNDPHVQARGMIVELPHWNGGSFRVSNTPIRLSETETGPTRGAARPGEHTAEILRQYAGLSEERLQELAERGVISLG